MSANAEKLEAALNLMRRLPPRNIKENLQLFCQKFPELTDDLLSMVDQPFAVRSDDTIGRKFILCDYNRDANSYRSPWSNTYFPPLEDAVYPSERMRKLEVELNEAIDGYRDNYYEGGVSSVYMWDTDDGFAGVICIKKDAEIFVSNQGSWEVMHVIDVKEKNNRAHYKLTSTLMQWIDIDPNAPDDKRFDMCGSFTKQTEQTVNLTDETPHLFNIGTMVEEQEHKLRDLLTRVYIGKSKQIISELFIVNADAQKQMEELANDIQNTIPK